VGEESQLQKCRSLGFPEFTPKLEDSKQSEAVRSLLALSRERSRESSPLPDWSVSGSRLLCEADVCTNAGGCNKASGCEDPLCCRLSLSSESETESDTSCTGRVLLMARNADWWIPNCVLTWPNGHREDYVGNRPVSVSIGGIVIRGLENVPARRARWYSVRRFVSDLYARYEFNSPIRLGFTPFDQCEIWECDDSCSYEQNNHIKSKFGGLLYQLFARTCQGDCSESLCYQRDHSIIRDSVQADIIQQSNQDLEAGISTQRTLDF